MDEVEFTLGGKRYSLSRQQVITAMHGQEPEALREHWVEVAGVRYPPKQVFQTLLKLDRADFQTNQARRQLKKLQFPVGRV